MKKWTLAEIRTLFQEWLDDDEDLFWHLEREEETDIYCGEKICIDGRALPFPLWLERRDA